MSEPVDRNAVLLQLGRLMGRKKEVTPAALGVTDREYHRLCGLGTELKKLYVAARRRTVPKYTPDPKTWGAEFWMKAALQLEAWGVDVPRYVDAQFARFPLTYPQPNMLLSEAGLPFYRDRVDSADASREADVLLASQRAVVDARMRVGASLPDLLVDAELGLNPVLAYCLARHGGYPTYADRLRPVAADYLKSFPQYRRTVLREFIDIPEAG